jgi:hypothetical protein
MLTLLRHENLEADLSILELYILVCMHRLEDKEHVKGVGTEGSWP